ncbi:hypothetical protein C7S13_0904 [Burkholderia cepacia]|nr:hypothetical protein [Burkholderia cepacia]
MRDRLAKQADTRGRTRMLTRRRRAFRERRRTRPRSRIPRPPLVRPANPAPFAQRSATISPPGAAPRPTAWIA